jgi:folate-binding protein YgfZ
MRSACSTVLLDALGVLRARGQDVLSFLQGQLSNDLTLLAADRSLLAGYHNPQGRVIALLHLLQLAPDDLLLLLPRELIAPVIARLSKFVLRAKVKLSDESPQWRISGLLQPATAGEPGGSDEAAAGERLLAALPAAANAAARIAAATAVRLAQEPARWLLVSPVSQPPLPGTRTAAEAGIWQRLAIAAGEPQVYAATSEEFVAQMLNLDCLGAIAFEKGCYTGQEVIARAHYRGRVKRRMQRFVMRAARQLRPADAGTLSDGRAFQVVEAVVLADGRCEFLAVAPLTSSESAPGVAAGTSHAGERFDAEALPLPYLLPS